MENRCTYVVMFSYCINFVAFCVKLEEYIVLRLIFYIFRIIPVAHKIRKPCGEFRSARLGDINITQPLLRMPG